MNIIDSGIYLSHILSRCLQYWMIKRGRFLHCRLIHRNYEFCQFVIFGNSLKNLNLNIRWNHSQLQGRIVREKLSAAGVSKNSLRPGSINKTYPQRIVLLYSLLEKWEIASLSCRHPHALTRRILHLPPRKSRWIILVQMVITRKQYITNYCYSFHEAKLQFL